MVIASMFLRFRLLTIGILGAAACVLFPATAEASTGMCVIYNPGGAPTDSFVCLTGAYDQSQCNAEKASRSLPSHTATVVTAHSACPAATVNSALSTIGITAGSSGTSGATGGANGGTSDPNKYVFLVNPLGGTGNSSQAESQGITSIEVVIGRVIAAFLGFAGSVALAAFIYGAFLWLTSAGKSDKIQQGIKTLTYATIGLFIIFGAYGILDQVLRILTTPTETVTETPANTP